VPSRPIALWRTRGPRSGPDAGSPRAAPSNALDVAETPEAYDGLSWAAVRASSGPPGGPAEYRYEYLLVVARASDART
jgi:hypothetical protein